MLKAERGLVEEQSPVRVWNLTGLGRWSGSGLSVGVCQFVTEDIAHRRGR